MITRTCQDAEQEQVGEQGRHACCRSEFTHLSEAEVWAAVAVDNGPVAAEVTRLVAQHAKRLKECADKDKSAPGVLMLIRTRCPIERVAVLMMAQAGAAVSQISVH